MTGTLPDQCNTGTWIGRVWLPEDYAQDGMAGPHVIRVESGTVYDVCKSFMTMADVFACQDPTAAVKACKGRELISLDELLMFSHFKGLADGLQGCTKPCLLAPNDLQAVKACGVTFARSLLERVIEERARGDYKLAREIRESIDELIGNNLVSVKPGSKMAETLKQHLIEEDLWSQYLEVGIGRDAEVFTKCTPLSAVTTGSQTGIMKTSMWNNPEPEIVIAVNKQGGIIGATLGNDVNHRDYEGRSALLLSKAKDQNATCSIGPLIRLFDDTFELDDIKQSSVTLSIYGEDGFVTSGENNMNEISRTPEELVSQTLNRNHQYPDGLMLFLGTMFAPTEDRDIPGEGFTHKPGDRVEISTPLLGKLVNWVNHCDEIPEWEYGLHHFVQYVRLKM